MKQLQTPFTWFDKAIETRSLGLYLEMPIAALLAYSENVLSALAAVTTISYFLVGFLADPSPKLRFILVSSIAFVSVFTSLYAGTRFLFGMDLIVSYNAIVCLSAFYFYKKDKINHAHE